MNTAKAEAEMAYGLQASKVQARIKEEEMQVERQQETNIIFIRSLSKSSTKMTHFFMEGRGREIPIDYTTKHPKPLLMVRCKWFRDRRRSITTWRSCTLHLILVDVDIDILVRCKLLKDSRRSISSSRRSRRRRRNWTPR